MKLDDICLLLFSRSLLVPQSKRHPGSVSFLKLNIPEASAATVRPLMQRRDNALIKLHSGSKSFFSLGCLFFSVHMARRLGGHFSVVPDMDTAGGHLLTSTRAAAVGVQFKVKPVQSNWQNNSHCPVLEIRGPNRGVYFQQGYMKCSILYNIWVCSASSTTGTGIAAGIKFSCFQSHSQPRSKMPWGEFS